MNVRALLLAIMAATALPAVATDRIPIADEGATSARWVPVAGTMATPVYPEGHAQDQQQVCLTVGYLLNADGHTSDFALLKSWNSKGNLRPDNPLWAAFAGSAARALAQWQFVPKPEITSPAPVYTAATFVFGSGDAAATRAHCMIPDLAARLVELRRDARASRMMAGGIFSRLDISRDLQLKYEIAEQQALARDSQRQETLARQDQLDEMLRQQMAQRTQQGSSGNK